MFLVRYNFIEHQSIPVGYNISLCQAIAMKRSGVAWICVNIHPRQPLSPKATTPDFLKGYTE